MVEGALLDPFNIVFMMTDALLSQSELPLKNLWRGEGKAPLGYWEMEKYDGGLFVGAGVYALWTLKLDEKTGELRRVSKTKTRGTDRSKVSQDGDFCDYFVEQVLNRWMTPNDTLRNIVIEGSEDNPTYHVRTVDMPFAQFQTAGLALTSPEAWACSGRFADRDGPHAAIRRMDVSKPGDKRDIPRDDETRTRFFTTDTRLGERCYSLMSTIPSHNYDGKDARSKPSEPRWGEWTTRMQKKQARLAREQLEYRDELEHSQESIEAGQW